MPEPEIARRCYHCGASIRERAFFCPQCGKELNWEQESTDNSNEVEPPKPALQETNPWLLETLAEGPKSDSAETVQPSFQETIAEGPKSDSTDAVQPSFQDTIADATTQKFDGSVKQARVNEALAGTNKQRRKKGLEPPPQEQNVESPPAGIAAAATTPTTLREPKKQRPASGAREIIEDNVLHRVERLRKVSTVVFDQAAYDPSLRFVLVAAVLFFLFLLIVLLSKLIG